jgi:hypothetical protein
MIPAARHDVWTCAACGTPHELGARSLEVGLVRLAVHGEDGFRLGSAGIEADVGPLLEPCACGGRLTRDPQVPGTAGAVPGTLRAQLLRPLAERGWAVLEASDDEGLARLRTLWRARALVLLGREDELTREQQLELRLEGRLAALAGEIERARAAGDEDAAQAAHARYIELGTTFVRRFASTADPG